MAPNLLVATQTLFQPRKWFRQPKSPKPKRMTERWELPVPGLYEYVPSRGWYLIEKDIVANTSEVSTKGGPVLTIGEFAPKSTEIQNPPVAVRYSRVLKRYLLAPDYQLRRKDGAIENTRGKLIPATFFRLDDGVSWVNFLDEHGEFIPGPYRLWVLDEKTDKFRHMLRRDDPEYQRSQTNSRTQSRQGSVDHDALSRRHSQESRNTEYRSGGPGSNRDGQSCPSTRAGSIQAYPSSKPNSNAPSRRGSLSRGLPSPRIPLDEAGAALRKLQKERAAKDAAAKQAADPPAEKESIKMTEAIATPEVLETQPTPNVDHSHQAVAAVGA